MSVRTRIAPSPTGIAHIGTAYMALFNYAYAQKNQGDFIIRIEDTDRARFVEGAEQVIYDSLDWLNIPHAEGPDKNGPHAPYRQSDRLPMYQQAAEELINKGHAYYCFCDPDTLNQMRTQQQQRKEIPRYDRRCLALDKTDIQTRLNRGDKHVIRLLLPDHEVISWQDLIRGHVEINTKEMDDQVLMKSDGFPTYHLAVVVDDHAMQISHIIRGEEWIPSTPKHILLYRFFDWELPQFAHMPLLRNPDKSKMSKRKNDVAIPSYREKGFLPEALVNYLCLMGWSHPEEKEIFDLNEFIATFTMERMLKSGPIFDINKLKWMNGKYLRDMSDEQLLTAIENWYLFYKPQHTQDEDQTLYQQFESLLSNQPRLLKTLPLIKERFEVLSDIFELTKFMQSSLQINKQILYSQNKQSEVDTIKLLAKVTEKLTTLENWSVQLIEETVRSVYPEFPAWKPRDFFMTIRVATTGFPVTPPLFESMELLGKDEILQRLKQVVQ